MLTGNFARGAEIKLGHFDFGIFMGVMAIGTKVQKEGEVIHVVVRRCYDLTGMLGNLRQPEARASEDQSTDYAGKGERSAKTKKKPEVAESQPAGEHTTAKNKTAFQYDMFYGGRNFR